MTGKNSEFSLYFHLPFCKKKCDYCHFFVLPERELHKDQLLHGLRKEWQLIKAMCEDKRLVSVYFGGGTPSLFGSDRVAEILSWINPGPIEITLEINPDGVAEELMNAYAKAGINRASLGVQSFDDNLLQTLSRTHSSALARRAVDGIYNAGISNISIDLMFDIPGQTLKQWETSLITACSLPITHISLYNLTFEPRTVFFKKRKDLQPQTPDEATSQAMYKSAQAILPAHGLSQYEISAFSKPGCQSLHNSGYWKARPFLGLGPSAFSYWRGSRFRNIASLNKYCRMLEEGKRPIDFEETLEPAPSLRERFVINLRLLEGVDLNCYPGIDSISLRELESNGLITLQSGKAKLTDLGILHYDTIAAELI